MSLKGPSILWPAVNKQEPHLAKLEEELIHLCYLIKCPILGLTVACFAHSVAFCKEVGQPPHSSINRGLPPTHIQTEA